MVSASVKNLIFDLGGVILDLSVDSTLQQFSGLSGLDKQQVARLFQTSSGFVDYEKGLISDNDFRDFVRKLYSVQATDQELDRCWNAMLVRIPPAKLSLLLKLKEQYNVILLSNTNTIHLNYINGTVVPAAGGHALDHYFHRSYYSHLLKKRKPDAEIFEQVLQENNLIAGQTLFLDDNAENIAGAQSLGIQTVHVTTPDLMLDYFHA
ncbi:MAG TPA: HAD family phosphatase [Ohtaekwangia sp.]